MLEALSALVEPVSRRARTAVSRRAMWLLLGALVLLIFVAPTVRANPLMFQLGTDVVLTLTIVSGTLALSPRRRVAIVVGMLGLAAFSLLLAQWAFPSTLAVALRDGAMLLTTILMAIAVGIYVFVDKVAQLDRIVGAIALYLLFALVFALGYSLIASYDPGAFSGVHYDPTRVANWFYFSLATLTTAGYGDIAPVASSARSLAMFEALMGQLYPAIIIAKLVGDDVPAALRDAVPPTNVKPDGEA